MIEASNSMGWIFWQLIFGLSLLIGFHLFQKVSSTYSFVREKVRSFIGK